MTRNVGGQEFYSNKFITFRLKWSHNHWYTPLNSSVHHISTTLHLNTKKTIKILFLATKLFIFNWRRIKKFYLLLSFCSIKKNRSKSKACVSSLLCLCLFINFILLFWEYAIQSTLIQILCGPECTFGKEKQQYCITFVYHGVVSRIYFYESGHQKIKITLHRHIGIKMLG